MTFSPRVCSTTSPATVTPSTRGAPTWVEPSFVTMRTWSNVTAAPGSPASVATVMTSLAATRYCLPPVLITANILILVFKPNSQRGKPPPDWLFGSFRLRFTAASSCRTDMRRHSCPLIEDAYLRVPPVFVNQKPRFWRLKSRKAHDIHPASTSGPHGLRTPERWQSG